MASKLHVLIILGSLSDQEILEASGMTKVFYDLKISYRVSVFSAHRHDDELTRFLKKEAQYTSVFICVAGMAAALPGAVVAKTDRMIPVIGVPLPSSEFPDAMDALLSMVRMPKGMPLAVPGIGKSGLLNAAYLAVQIIGVGDPDLRARFDMYLSEHVTPPVPEVKSGGEED